MMSTTITVTPATAPRTAPSTARWFLRCAECLVPVALDSERRPSDTIECVCGGKLSVMGRVHRGRVVEDRERCACDSRCTHAKGPSCDCVCGGENHGSGALVSYTVDNGAARMVTTTPEKQLARAAEFRAALADVDAAIAADTRLAGALADMAAGVYIDRTSWELASRVRRARSAARGCKVHGTRIKQLSRLAADIRARVI